MTSYWDTQDYNLTPNDHIGSLAEVAIDKIIVKGGIFGGAAECT